MERVMGRQTDQQRGPTEWDSTKRNMITKNTCMYCNVFTHKRMIHLPSIWK